MKKLLYILFAVTLFASCSSSDDDNGTTPSQDYTSFVVTIDTSNKLTNCVAGYYTADGLCKKLGDLGKLTRGVYSPEIRVDNDTITRIYIFSNTTKPLRIKEPYFITKNEKNNIIVQNAASAISITEWPE